VVCDKDAAYTDRARYILANASSMEAYLEPRFEFAELQLFTDAPASLYVHTRLGFVALANSPRVFANQELGLGLVINSGDYEGSYLEAGFGKDELFSKHYSRVMLDGLASYSPSVPIPKVRDWIANHVRAFAQVTVNNDLGTQPDAIRVFVGFDFSPKSLLFQ
jgi:hypothetical protein